MHSGPPTQGAGKGYGRIEIRREGLRKVKEAVGKIAIDIHRLIKDQLRATEPQNSD